MPDRYIAKPVVYYRQHRCSIATFARDKSASETIGSITPGSGFSAITSGAWDMISAIRHILSEIGASDVWVSTWVPGMQEIVDLKYLIDLGMIRNIKLLVDQGFETSRRSHAEMMVETIGPQNILVGRNHSKIALFRNDKFHYVLRGSCNLNTNRRAENIDGDESESLFNAFLEFFNAHQDLGGTGFGRSGVEVRRTHKQIMRILDEDSIESDQDLDLFLRSL
jgi:hypothetical protein